MENLKIKIIPLGGLGEIGANTMALEIADEILIIDCGLGFPDDSLIGVDILIPNYSYLKENQAKIKALVLTHGHEDHIGGVPYLLKEVKVPKILTSKLTNGLLEHKLIEHDLVKSTTLINVEAKDVVSIGNYFEVKFIACTHSIADAFSIIIKTPLGLIIHTGDFKFDYTPIDGKQYDFQSLIEVGNENLLLLMSDSTNIERDGYTPSEAVIKPKFHEIFRNAKERIIVTTFASNIHRMAQVLETAQIYDRKVAILGRSMLKYAKVARDLGYIAFSDNLIVPVGDLPHLPKEQIVVLTTGSQGEPLAALNRMALAEHKQIKITPGDTVLFSATPIPGNERLVANTINGLFFHGANVIYGKKSGIHVSGHASKSEQRLMLEMAKPKFFIPIHGEYRMLVKHGELARSCGIAPENIFVMDNGDVLEMDTSIAKIVDKVPAHKKFIESYKNWDINLDVISERRLLMDEGVISMAFVFNKDNLIIQDPIVKMKGLLMPKYKSTLDIQQQLISYVKDRFHSENTNNLNEEELKLQIKLFIEDFFENVLRAHPLKQIHFHKVN